MVDLLVLLLATLSGLLQPGVSAPQLEAKLAQVVKAGQPAPLDDVTAEAQGVSPAGADRVDFHFTNITLDKLKVGRATFSVLGVKKTAGADKLSLKSIGWSAAIGEKELTSALQAQGGKMKSAVVTIAPGGLTLRGKWPLGLGAKVNYSVTGNLDVEGSQLLFHIQKSDVSGVGVPKGINAMIEKQVNPVYDFAKFAARSAKEIQVAREKLNYDFKLTITKVQPQAGHIIVYGSA